MRASGGFVARAATIAFVVAAVAALHAGCGLVGISTTSYSTDCTSPGDCRPVHEGDACSGCQLDNAAINVRDLHRYQKDAAALQRECVVTSYQQCDDFGPTQLTCTAGKCGLAE